jgi:cupin 2 domain-containing protein
VHVRSQSNLFEGIPAVLAEEFTERLAGRNGARVERIVSRGHASPAGFWYDQPETEWVVLVSGRARLRFDGGATVELAPGDHLTIPPHTRHRVEWTTDEGDTVWLAVFF